jgi:hypothetical protein
MHQMFNPVLANFRANRSRIKELLGFDDLLLGFILKPLKTIQEAQDRAKQRIDNPNYRVDKVITLLESIRSNHSLATHFATVHNQALVLLVSHFAAALRDAYRTTVRLALTSEVAPAKLLDEELKVTVARLISNQGDPLLDVADLLIDKKDLSFQDMKGTGRAFEELCGVSVPKGSGVNDIIAAQACRHGIVHAGEVVTQQMIRQLAGATPRRLKISMVVDAIIRFSPEEVELAGDAMEEYLSSLMQAVTVEISAPI